MLSTSIRKNESFEKAVRRFETECRKARIIQTCIEKLSYTSPSEKRRLLKRRKKRQRAIEH